MAKHGYLQHKGERFYPNAHTKATYDNNGKVLEDRLVEINKTVSKFTTEHQIFVLCNGDHDELKLQTAINNAPENSVIYPVGASVITNDNAQVGIGDGTYNSYGIILQIGENQTIDGRYCPSMTFINSNPQTDQIIFQLKPNAKIKNLYFSEDTETVTEETVNPSIIYNTGYEYEISNCNFVNLKDTGETVNTLIYLESSGKGIFKGNTISNCLFSPLSTFNARIHIGSKTTSIIEDNIFEDINYGNANSVNNSYAIYLNGFICKNHFRRIDLENNNIECYGTVCTNTFQNITDVDFVFDGIINGNKFLVCVLNSQCDDVFISVNSLSRFTDNSFTGMRVQQDGCCILSAEANCKISDNIIRVSNIVDNTICISTAQGQIHHNTIILPTSYISNNTIDSFGGCDGAVITDNITNAISLGTFDDTCVVERNITGKAGA